MVRIFAFAVGLLFTVALLVGLLMPREDVPENVIEKFHQEPRELSLASDGVFGRFDRQQLQRGFQVYKEVCSACHSMKLVAFRDLEQIGYNEAEVKAIAKNWAVETPTENPDTGEPATRPSLPSDRIPSPYANDIAAKAANNNAVPPDMSLLAKAREGGAAYIYSIVTGYRPVPKDLPTANRPATGLHYNPWFATLNIAMPPPLTTEGQVTYGPGNPKPTVDQMAEDVSAFLVWAAEPKLESRHRTGAAVLIFLIIATVLAYGSYRNIWADRKH